MRPETALARRGRPTDLLLPRADPFIIFSGGIPPHTDQQQAAAPTAATAGSPPPKPSSFFLTILRGQTTNVLHMDSSIVDFLVITPSPHIAGSLSAAKEIDPYSSSPLDAPDPSAVVVLLENDLVVIDLKSEK